MCETNKMQNEMMESMNYVWFPCKFKYWKFELWTLERMDSKHGIDFIKKQGGVWGSKCEMQKLNFINYLICSKISLFEQWIFWIFEEDWFVDTQLHKSCWYESCL